jgi:hypothetical protein
VSFFSKQTIRVFSTKVLASSAVYLIGKIYPMVIAGVLVSA